MAALRIGPTMRKLTLETAGTGKVVECIQEPGSSIRISHQGHLFLLQQTVWVPRFHLDGDLKLKVTPLVGAK